MKRLILPPGEGFSFSRRRNAKGVKAGGILMSVAVLGLLSACSSAQLTPVDENHPAHPDAPAAEMPEMPNTLSSLAIREVWS